MGLIIAKAPWRSKKSGLIHHRVCPAVSVCNKN